MEYSARNALDALLQQTARRTADAPQNERGLYGLIDHLGHLRYIGSTSSTSQSLYKRIHQRHRTGSEDMSHYFSYMYNVGRMWRDRKDLSTVADGGYAKALRNAFVADHCAAIWLPIPGHVDISALEREVIAIAPAEAIAWNRKAAAAFEEPQHLVDLTIARLGWGPAHIEAIERQRRRYLTTLRKDHFTPPPEAQRSVRDLPLGEFRFVALDVETANYNCASICQIGLAFVRPDRTIQTWVTYIDPQTDDWSCSRIHGITARTVRGAPTFDQILPLLETALTGQVVYQHSSFDQTAINAACTHGGIKQPTWVWRDSVQVARGAWPELKGNGGHGLASLKRHLGLNFVHHDAEEDARASAEVVLRAEALAALRTPPVVQVLTEAQVSPQQLQRRARSSTEATPTRVTSAPVTDTVVRHLGITRITEGNIRHNHIYLRHFFDKFPSEAVGGSNRASSASTEISIDWGGADPVLTDLDGDKKFFRRRGWVAQFFKLNKVAVGSAVSVDEIAPLRYRVSLIAL
ncbi:exonuclease domain-containing protein [Bosea sp. AS-1]|uniref:exonuclease domain-containing protein n=1 Tax=Bosea sp. AS-1 TaxID=2015316 RepID=UPI000B770A94|nr:exonuclease domain-containing protein [Bosea sp. AS-1]